MLNDIESAVTEAVGFLILQRKQNYLENRARVRLGSLKAVSANAAQLSSSLRLTFAGSTCSMKNAALNAISKVHSVSAPCASSI